MKSRRGFTIIEMVLASMLGSLVVAVCLGVFGAISRSDDRSADRARQVLEITRTHAAAQKAMRLLVMDQPNILAQALSGGAAPPPQGRPRIILEKDGENPWQRLELVVAEPPLLGSKPKKADGDPLSRYAAVRGAFELRVDNPEKPDSKSLYWVNFSPGGAEQHDVASESLLATDLKRVVWRLAKTNAETKQLVRLDDARIASWNDLPAFVEMGVETNDGRKSEWMFEVCWSVAAKPKFGGIMDLMGGGGAPADETTTGGETPTTTPTDPQNPQNPQNPQTPGGPTRMSDLEFLQVMVSTLRNIRPTSGNADLYRRMLRQYEQQLRDYNDPPAGEP